MQRVYNKRMETTEQVEKKVPNPTGKGGFQDHPELINPGGRPKNVNSFAHWYRVFKEMTVKDFLKWEKRNPEGKRNVVATIAYQTVKDARTDLKTLQEVADRSEGKAPQTLIHEGGLFQETELRIIEVDDNPEVEQETEANPEATE